MEKEGSQMERSIAVAVRVIHISTLRQEHLDKISPAVTGSRVQLRTMRESIRASSDTNSGISISIDCIQVLFIRNHPLNDGLKILMRLIPQFFYFLLSNTCKKMSIER